MAKVKLDKDEAEILETFESGKLKRSSDVNALLEKHKDYADATLRQDVRNKSDYLQRACVACKSALLKKVFPNAGCQ